MKTSLFIRNVSFGTLALLISSATIVQGQIVRGPNGHFYQVIAAPAIVWDDANAAANGSSLCGKSGHLATITSNEENDFVNSIRDAFVTANGGGPQYWVGGFQTSKDDEPRGNWMWVNGEGSFPGANTGPAFSKWAAGEPNDCGGVEEHLTLGRFANSPGQSFDGSLWNDEGCAPGSIAGYIVEYDSDATVIIGGCNSGVPNIVVDADLCTISDLIAACAAGAKNHGDFVSCVAAVTNALNKAGLISGSEKGSIQSCAAKANIP